MKMSRGKSRTWLIVDVRVTRWGGVFVGTLRMLALKPCMCAKPLLPLELLAMLGGSTKGALTHSITAPRLPRSASCRRPLCRELRQSAANARALPTDEENA